MNKQANNALRLNKRTVASLRQVAPSERHTTLVLVTTSGITSTIIYTLDPPLQG